MISIPPRYGTNLSMRCLERWNCYEFQFLQGTVQTQTPHLFCIRSLYFNSSKVRYKPTKLGTYVIIKKNFNSSKVRYKLMYYFDFCLLLKAYFNSSKVRYKPFSAPFSSFLWSLFQFLQGTVQTSFKTSNRRRYLHYFNSSKVRYKRICLWPSHRV